MTASQQLGSQVKEARVGAGLTLRGLAERAHIPWTSIAGYEKGKRIPADKFLRIADALDRHTFKIDGNSFTVTRMAAERPDTGRNEQLKLDFSGEYRYSNAKVRIRPGRLEVFFSGTDSPLPKTGSGDS
jgi:transcriptional regulator with XRE-family HTH domain